MKFVVLFLLSIALVKYSAAQNSNVVYVSSSIGNDLNIGNSPNNPKNKFLTAIQSASSNLNPLTIRCLAGDTFNENYFSNRSLNIKSYALTNTNKISLAAFNGSTVKDTGWQKEIGFNNVYSITVQPEGYIGNGVNGIGQYSFIYVTEVAKNKEIAFPFTAKKPMIFASNLAQVDTLPGSYYEAITIGPIAKKIYVHTSNGLSPNLNVQYRYQIAVKDWVAYLFGLPNNTFEKLWVYGYGAGVGMLPTGSNSFYNRCILGPGGGIHHIGIRNGTINKCLLLPASKNVTQFSVVFYNATGNNWRNFISNTIFLGINEPLYTHTSGGPNLYASLHLNKVIAFAETKGMGVPIIGNNVDSLIVDGMYAQNYGYVFRSSYPNFLSIKNSIFLNASFGVSFLNKPITSIIENNLIKVEKEANTFGINVGDTTHLTIKNSILQVDCSKQLANSTSFIINGSGKKSNNSIVVNNIFIASTDSISNIGAGKGFSINAAVQNQDFWDYNIYVLLKGKKIVWGITNSINNSYITLNSLQEWQTQTGQDKNSLYIDLRNDSLGLKSIFIDPDNGNYSLANTPLGNQIKNIRAGMQDPLQCLIKIPTQEQAAAMVMNDNIVSINQCENPCNSGNLNIDYQFSIDTLSTKKVRISWQNYQRNGLLDLQLLRAENGSNFTPISPIPIEDSSFFFIDSNIIAGKEYKYTVVAIQYDSTMCNSTTAAVTIPVANKITIYPNPNNGENLFINTGNLKGNVHIDIINALGQKVFEKNQTILYLQPIKLATHLSKGIYLVKISSEKNTTVKKLVIE